MRWAQYHDPAGCATGRTAGTTTEKVSYFHIRVDEYSYIQLVGSLIAAELGLGQQPGARAHTLHLQGRLARVISTNHLEMLIIDLALPSLGVVVLSELVLREPARWGIVSSEVAPEPAK